MGSSGVSASSVTSASSVAGSLQTLAYEWLQLLEIGHFEGRHTLVDGLESFDEGKLLGFIVKEAIFLFDDVLQRLEVPGGRVVVLFNLCA